MNNEVIASGVCKFTQQRIDERVGKTSCERNIKVVLEGYITDYLQIRVKKAGKNNARYQTTIDVYSDKDMCVSAPYGIFGRDFHTLLQRIFDYNPDGDLDIREIEEIIISNDNDCVHDIDNSYYDEKTGEWIEDHEYRFDEKEHRDMCLDEKTLRLMILTLDGQNEWGGCSRTYKTYEDALNNQPKFEDFIKKQMDYKFKRRKEPTYESYIERAKKMFITAITTIYKIRQNVYDEEIAVGFEKGETFYAKAENRKENENYDFDFFLTKEIDNLDLSDLPCIDTKEKWSLICRNELWQSENFYIKDEETQELFLCMYNFFYY